MAVEKDMRKTIRMPEFRNYIRRAVKLGAKEAGVIRASSIVVAEWVRMKCQFGCDGFGQSLTCPPYSPAPETTRKIIACYKRALLVRGNAYTEIHALIPALEQEIFLDGYFKAFGMGAGPCQLCVKCAKYCRHPDKTRPSMEACGIDVYSTVKNNGYPIKVLKDGNCKGNYYGVVLIE